MRLRECRENAGFSQKYVAIELGISAPSVANWERGKTKPTRENTIRLADLYGVSVDYLLGRTDATSPAEESQVDICPSNPDDEYKLSDSEKKLLRRFRSLDEDDQEAVLYRALELIKAKESVERSYKTQVS